MASRRENTASTMAEDTEASLVQAALVRHTTATEQRMDVFEQYMMEMAKNFAVMKAIHLQMLQDLQELKDARGLRSHSESSIVEEEIKMEEFVTASQADSSVSTFPSCSLPTVLSSSHSSILCSGNLSQSLHEQLHEQETRNLQSVRSNACEKLKNEKSNFNLNLSSHGLKPSSSSSTKLSKTQKLVFKYPHLLFVVFPKKKMRNRKFVKAKKKNVKKQIRQDFCYISTSKSNKLHCQNSSKFSISPKSCFTWYVSPTDSGYSFNSVRKKNVCKNIYWKCGHLSKCNPELLNHFSSVFLNCFLVKRGGKVAATQVLLKWIGLPFEEATWMFYHDFIVQFPDFHL